jgi:ribonuclease P protein component
MDRFTLNKTERLYHQKSIEALFAGGNPSFPVYPFRVVYRRVEDPAAPTAAILISVPKKRFKRAVKRNRVKRQVREAYRKQKQLLIEPLQAAGIHVHVAFIWLDAHLHPSDEIEAKVRKLLLHMVDKLVPVSEHPAAAATDKAVPTDNPPAE